MNLKSVVIIFLLFTSFIAFSQQANIEESIYHKNFDDILDNEYVKTLFKKSTLNTDSILKNIKPQKPSASEQTVDKILKSIEKTIPLNYHPEVNSFIAIYSKGVNIHFLNYLINYYQSEIIDELKKQGLPEELSFLPAILSDFNPYSVNGLGGEGYWLMYYPQAIKQGLKITEYVDERRDFTKSTKAAIGYLKLLQNEYQNWELTLAAYVCGPTTINNMMVRKKAKNYWQIYPYLNPKVRDVVPALTALIYNRTTNTSNQIKINPQLEVDTFYIAKKLVFKAITDVTKIENKTLQFFNPTIINDAFPKNYVAQIPKKNSKEIKQLRDSLYYYQDSILFKPTVITEENNNEIADKEEIYYKVKAGDVLGKIAEKYGVKISQLQEWNKLKGTTINIGQNLKIKSSPNLRWLTEGESPSLWEGRGGTNLQSPISNLQSQTTEYILYTVKEGDNLWDISLNYDDVTPDDIMELNTIDANLKIGQVLKIKKK